MKPFLQTTMAAPGGIYKPMPATDFTPAGNALCIGCAGLDSSPRGLCSGLPCFPDQTRDYGKAVIWVKVSP